MHRVSGGHNVPPRLTPSERRLRGTQPHPERIAGYIAPLAKPPRPPSHLRAAGRRAWRELWRAGSWLTRVDTVLMEILCARFDERERLERLIAAQGDVTTGSEGQPVAHPAYRIRAQNDTALQRELVLAGFTPTARRRLGIETRTPPPPDPLDAFLEARPQRVAESNAASPRTAIGRPQPTGRHRDAEERSPAGDSPSGRGAPNQ
jgi:P27 family predicted phage terminase small subunit